MQLEELSEDKLTDKNRKVIAKQRDEHILEKVTLAEIYRLKELSEIYHDLEVQRVKCWKVIHI